MRVLKALGKFLLAIVSFILCVVLFASTLVTMLVADVKVATNKDNLQNLLKQTLAAPVQQTTLRPLTAAAGSGFEFDLGSGDISGALVEFAYESMKEAAGGELPMTLDDVKEFVEKSTLKEFIAEKSASIISDIYTGENTTNISVEEVEKLLTDNKDVIEEYFNIELTDEQIQQVNQAINEIPVVQQIREEGVASVIMGNSNPAVPDEDLGDGTTGTTDTTDISDTWYGKLPGIGGILSEGGSSNIMNNPVALALEIVRFYTSDAVLWSCIGVCAVLVGLLFLCAWNKPYKAMTKSGITFLLASAGFLIPTLVAWLSPATWMETFSFMPIVGTVSRFILMLTGGVCGTVAGLGVALIAGGITVKVLMRKKKAALTAAETAVIEEAAAEEVALEEAAEEVAVEEATAEETPVEEAPAEEVPAEEAPVVEAAEEAPADETPAEKAPAEETV